MLTRFTSSVRECYRFAVTTEPRITILRNVRAPKGPVNALVRLLEADGANVAVHDTVDMAHGERVAREEGPHSTALVAAGGDGTLLSTLAASLDTGVAVATLPLGTTNDLAVHLGMQSVDDVAAAITRRSKKRIDVVQCTFVDPQGEQRTLPFVTSAGVGALGDVSRRERSGAAGWVKRTFGNAAWPLLFGSSFRRLRESRASIELGDTVVDEPLSVFEVCKVPAPGGLKLAPGARFDSGILHAFYCGEVSATAFFYETMRAAALDGPVRSRRVQYMSNDPSTNHAHVSNVRRVHIAPREPMAVHVHGEYVGTTPATFEIADVQLEVFMPLAQPSLMPLPSWRPSASI